MKSKEDLQSFFDNLGRIKSVKDLTNGHDQLVYLVELEDDFFIFKEAKKEPHKLENEEIACAVCKELDIPAPVIVKKTDDYLIETIVQGSKFDSQTPLEAYEQAGSELKKLHGKVAPYVGEKGWEISSNHIDIFNRHMPDDIAYLSEHYKTDVIKKYFENNMHYLQYENPVFTHGDLVDEHMFTENGIFNGFIDFGDLFGGRPADDFAKLYIEHPDDEQFQAFVRGYGPIDMDEVRFFAVYALTWRLAWKLHDEGKVNEKQEKLFFDLIK